MERKMGYFCQRIFERPPILRKKYKIQFSFKKNNKTSKLVKAEHRFIFKMNK